MRIVFTGGGSAGHVIPNVAVIGALKGGDHDILYVGSKRGMERVLVEKEGVRFEAISCGKLRRYFSWENFKDFFRVPVGMMQARRVLKEFGPDVVFSKGGYVSLPVVMAAATLGIRVILHESDLRPGLANRLSFRFVKKICVSFEETRSFIAKKWLKKVIVTGTPVRDSIVQGDADKGRKLCVFDRHRPVILVMGGSQGAVQINKLLRGSLDELLKRYQIVHIAGRGNIEMSLHKKGYKQFEYLNEELRDVYALCELVVTRGGANSLAEIAALGKKAVVIPMSLGSRGDQVENANLFARKFGWSVLTGPIGEERFKEALEMAYRNEVKGAAQENGVKQILELVLNRGL